MEEVLSPLALPVFITKAQVEHVIAAAKEIRQIDILESGDLHHVLQTRSSRSNLFQRNYPFVPGVGKETQG